MALPTDQNEAVIVAHAALLSALAQMAWFEPAMLEEMKFRFSLDTADDREAAIFAAVLAYIEHEIDGYAEYKAKREAGAGGQAV